MKTSSNLLRGLLVAVALLAAHGAQAALTENFDSGNGGWGVIDLAGSGDYLNVKGNYSVVHSSTGGAAGGYISASDPSVYSFYFDAPAAFTGNLSAYAGGTLSFDTYYTPQTNPWRDDGDVLLVSGSQVLVWRAAANPGSDWTHVSVAFDAAQDWRVGSINGSHATAAQLNEVLANLTALRIRGEYVSGVVETTGLDNVTLAPVPEPETWAMLLAGLGMIGVSKRRRAQGGK